MEVLFRMDSPARSLKKDCSTCRYCNRQRSLCIECNCAYETRWRAMWDRVGWEPNEMILEEMEQQRIGNKEW